MTDSREKDEVPDLDQLAQMSEQMAVSRPEPSVNPDDEERKTEPYHP